MSSKRGGLEGAEAGITGQVDMYGQVSASSQWATHLKTALDTLGSEGSALRVFAWKRCKQVILH